MDDFIELTDNHRKKIFHLNLFENSELLIGNVTFNLENNSKIKQLFSGFKMHLKHRYRFFRDTDTATRIQPHIYIYACMSVQKREIQAVSYYLVVL